jgi:hypothetical protein
MIHVVVMKCFIGLPLLIHIELLWRSRSRSFKNRGVGVGIGVGSFKNREVGVRVGAFVYRFHSPARFSEFVIREIGAYLAYRSRSVILTTFPLSQRIIALWLLLYQVFLSSLTKARDLYRIESLCPQRYAVTTAVLMSAIKDKTCFLLFWCTYIRYICMLRNMSLLCPWTLQDTLSLPLLLTFRD